MAELTLQQIAEKLNEAFAAPERTLVFWYDDKADFAEDIDSLPLENAKVLKLEKNTQFQTKYFLERQDKTTNYLVYAPFTKPLVRENHLEDVLLYSKRFYADRASLLCADLGIAEEYKPVLERHIKYFAKKERTQRFCQLQIDQYDEESIETGMMSALCRLKVCSFEETLRCVLCGALTDNSLLEEFAKYDLHGGFWKQCGRLFDFADEEPTLPKLTATLFITAADSEIAGGVPAPWKSFVSRKAGSIAAFLDSMKDNVRYGKRYDELSDYVAGELRAAQSLRDRREDELAECTVFRFADERLIAWIQGRLLHEDTGASLGQYTIPTLCEYRKQTHFGRYYGAVYDMLACAWQLISAAHYRSADGFSAIIDQYTRHDYRLDRMYRKFYQYYDSLDDPRPFEGLRELTELIYTNEFLGRLLPKWNDAIQEEDVLRTVPLQRNFYHHFVQPHKKERVVVIISDAMRYEVGRELLEKLEDDPNGKAKLDYMIATVPSYTQLGMAALLPHHLLELTEDGKVLTDGRSCADLPSRQRMLQQTQPSSCCFPFDDLKNAKREEVRSLFRGMQVVYLYHDQIDVRGEHAEDEVFTACAEAVREIFDMIHRIFICSGAYHFIVTADHGFIYKRDKMTESDKISGVGGAITKRRYCIADEAADEAGIAHLSLGYVLGNNDRRVVSFPCSTHVFKVAGGGQNYVHGGSSPQEMILPVLDVKMERGHMETHPARIALVSMIRKVTNLNITLEFIQSEPVSDVVKEAAYSIVFVDDEGRAVSQEQIYTADSRSSESKDRLFTKKFRFKNQQYDRSRKYYLIIKDKQSGLEVLREEVMMDLAFSDDFGFDI